MTTDPEQIRAQIAALLADLPDPGALGDDGRPLIDGEAIPDADIDTIAARLEEAHDLLVRALESVDRGPVNGGLGTATGQG